MILYTRTKFPRLIPIFFAKSIPSISIPSIAPPNLTARPLPIPDITPPNIAHKNRSLFASGDAIDTSIGSTSEISHAKNEYIRTVYIA